MSSDSSQLGAHKGPARRFIGVSLGGARGKTTAIARLEWKEDGTPLVLVEARVKVGHRGSGAEGLVEDNEEASPRLGYFRDEALVRYLKQWPGEECVLAMDVPLSLPPCLRCDRECPGQSQCTVPEVVWMREQVGRLLPRSGRSDRDKPRICPYSERATDLVNAYFGDSGAEALAGTVGPLAARAHYLKKHLRDRFRCQENWIEVCPRTAITRCMGKKLELATRRGSYEEVWLARRSVLLRAIEGLEVRGVWPDMVARNVHVFRALVSAWLAHRWDRCGRPHKPVIHARTPSEDAVNAALQEALGWCFWDESGLGDSGGDRLGFDPSSQSL